jgi:hypothetical protein
MEIAMNKFLEAKIGQKAKWVSRRYPELPEKDLIQEGSELVCKLQNLKGKNVSVHYLLKAISFHFSNLMRTTNARHNVKMFNILSLPDQIDSSVEKEFQDIENKIDRERFIKSLKDNNLIKVMTSLMEGSNLKEIAEENNISIRNAYRCVARLTKLREAWEK